MTEQQIRDGFEQLDASLAPPMDVAERVERRMAVRRRRRRTSLAGGAVLALAVTGGSVVALASGDGGTGDTVASDPSAPLGSTLQMTRPDGSTYAFPDVTVSCRPPEIFGDSEPEASAAGRIYLVSPIEVSGAAESPGDASAPDSTDARPTHPFVLFEGIVDKLQGTPTFTFPTDWTSGSDQFPMTLFIADSEGDRERSNEVASSAGGESGTVRVLEASCDPEPVLRLDVDMTLGSEVGQQSIDLAGTVR